MHRGDGGEIVQQSGLSHEVAMKIIESHKGTSTFMFMGDSVIQIKCAPSSSSPRKPQLTLVPKSLNSADERKNPEKDWVKLARDCKALQDWRARQGWLI